MAQIVFDGLETKEERKCIRTLTQFGLRRKTRVLYDSSLYLPTTLRMKNKEGPHKGKASQVAQW